MTKGDLVTMETLHHQLMTPDQRMISFHKQLHLIEEKRYQYEDQSEDETGSQSDGNETGNQSWNESQPEYITKS